MLFWLYYFVAVVVLAAYFTGYLARRNLEWLLYLLAVTVFPAMVYL